MAEIVLKGCPMSYLPFIEDNNIKEIVFKVLQAGIEKKNESENEFYKNVIDPFSALFEVAAFGVNLETWKESELIRQCQKTLQNQIGTFHQNILGSVLGWSDLGVGSVIDLKNEKKKIIAEVKNKYNTVSGGELSAKYNTLQNLVMPKNSEFKNYTAYFVNIIPKTANRFDNCFQPSDKETGTKCQKNEQIRIIDGASFYELVTGEKDALGKVYSVLPKIIEDLFREKFNRKFIIPDKDGLNEFFQKAYFKNIS